MTALGLVLLLVLEDAPPGLVSLIRAPVWVLWRLGLIVAGSRRRLSYHRLQGTAFMTYPLVTELAFVRSEATLVLALLGIMTGFGMWLGGAVVRQLSPPTATNTQSPDESAFRAGEQAPEEETRRAEEEA